MEHLVQLSKDSRLKKVIVLQEPIQLKKKKPVYLHLCSSIMSQQLSTRVAAVIYARFLQLYPGTTPTPRQIVETPLETLRAIGLSNAKASYLHNVCNFFIDEQLTDAKLNKLTDEELISYLCRIKGVGQWTVEMILMFTLAREDVFAVDDLGIQQSMQQLYKLQHLDKKKLKIKMIQIAERWRPYRTYACRYLWGWKDNKVPVPAPKQPD